MKLLKVIPHILTLFNLLSGVFGITYLMDGQIVNASIMIFIGAGFDFLDGFAARAFDAKSELGKQLDSLADLATFGILPSLIVFSILSSINSGWMAYVGLAIALGAGFRLAKFNIDQRQTNYFIGLPTPANALLISSLPFLIQEEYLSGFFTTQALVSLSLLLAILMVSPMPLLSFKFSHYRWTGNKFRYLLILLFLVSAYYYSFLAIPIIFVLYILFSIVSRPGKTVE